MDTEMSILLAASQSNCTSLPDKLDDINHHEKDAERTITTAAHSRPSNCIPSIVINMNPSSLPVSRKCNKRSNSVLVRKSPKDNNHTGKQSSRESSDAILTSGSTKKSKLDFFRLKILHDKLAKSNNKDEADSGLCSTNEEINHEHGLNKHRPGSRSETVDKQQAQSAATLLSSLPRPFRPINKSGSVFDSPKSPKSQPAVSFSPHKHTTIDDEYPQQPPAPLIGKSSSVRSRNIHFEMPSLTEINETDRSNNQTGSKMTLVNAVSSSNLSINQTDNNTGNCAANQAMMANVSKSNASNLFLEYLINNSKSSSESNEKFSNLATLAALMNLGDEMNTRFDMINSTNETALRNFLMELVSPPLAAVSSQFDLSSAESCEPVAGVELQFNLQNQLNSENNLANNSNSVYNKLPVDSSSFNLNGNSTNVNTNSNTNTIGNVNSTNSANSKKQLNEQIMRACMGYLDYINKKHNRERRIQIIRNKISGFVLLTLVFLLIFGLALVMTFCIGKAFSKMLNKKTINTTGTMISTTTAAASSINGYDVESALGSEKMITQHSEQTNRRVKFLKELESRVKCMVKNLSNKYELANELNYKHLVTQLDENFFNATLHEIENLNKSTSTVPPSTSVDAMPENILLFYLNCIDDLC